MNRNEVLRIAAQAVGYVDMRATNAEFAEAVIGALEASGYVVLKMPNVGGIPMIVGDHSRPHGPCSICEDQGVKSGGFGVPMNDQVRDAAKDAVLAAWRTGVAPGRRVHKDGHSLRRLSGFATSV